MNIPFFANFKSLYVTLNTAFQGYFKSRQVDYPYKLVDYYYCDKRGSIVVVMQLKNKEVVKTVSPESVLIDESLIRLISQEHVRLITYLACSQKFSASYSIEAQNMGEELLESTIEVRHLTSNKLENKRIADVITDMNMLSKMEAKDAFRLGFMAGTSSVINEKVSVDGD